MKKKIILTFDVEYWFNSRFLNKYLSNFKNPPDSTEKSIELILRLLKEKKAAATFFVLGKIAAQYPEQIKKIWESGQEIASHGYSHKYLEEMTPAEFEREIIETNRLLKIAGQKNILGFRAPAFSLNSETAWSLDILKKHGFIYDSSVFPAKMGIYGENLKKLEWRIKPITELPVAVFKKWFVKIPVAGGIYFRLLPYWLFRLFLKSVAQKQIPVVYLHNHELIECKPVLKNCPHWKKWLKFKGVQSCAKKLERLMSDFDCVSASQHLKKNENNFNQPAQR